jgi:hypothetical protein
VYPPLQEVPSQTQRGTCWPSDVHLQVEDDSGCLQCCQGASQRQSLVGTDYSSVPHQPDHTGE